jgi:hypothetical protein
MPYYKYLLFLWVVRTAYISVEIQCRMRMPSAEAVSHMEMQLQLQGKTQNKDRTTLPGAQYT